MSWPWSELGLDGPSSLEEVRRAYAQRVKEVHPEEDPEGFQRLHTAYQQARQAARRAKRHGQAAPDGAGQPEPQRPASPEPETDSGPGLDIAALLQEEGEKSAPEEPKQRAPQLDFDALLKEEEPQEEPRPRARRESWDFQHIFREEDARRAQGQSGGEENRWLDRALELVELLLEEERPLQDWERFLISPVFFRVKWDARFMEALADAFVVEPVKDPRIRKAVCGSYGLESGRVPQELKGFYQAVSGQTEQPASKEKKRFRKRHPLLFFLAVVVVLSMLVRTVIALGVYLYELPDRQMVARLCQYIEEDYGYPVESQYAGHLTSPKLFYLPVQQMSFTAWPEGERDPAQGRLGYETDLANRMLTQELEAFAETWRGSCTLTMTDSQGNGLSVGEMPAIYTFSTSLLGGEEVLTALGEEMERLAQESWYTLWSPSFQLQMEAWGMPYFTYTASDGPFPEEEILSYYQEELPVEIVTYLVEGCELRALDFGDRAYHMENLGTITLQKDDYVLLGGVEESTGETTRMYLYNSLYLVSVPAAEFDPGMSYMDYAGLLMGGHIAQPEDDPPWPKIAVCRH